MKSTRFIKISVVFLKQTSVSGGESELSSGYAAASGKTITAIIHPIKVWAWPGGPQLALDINAILSAPDLKFDNIVTTLTFVGEHAFAIIPGRSEKLAAMLERACDRISPLSLRSRGMYFGGASQKSIGSDENS